MRGRKFLFDNSFDEAAQNRLKAEADARARREAEALANTPPTFTVEELEAAKAAAYQQGRQDGMTDALGGIEQQISLSLEAIINRLPGFGVAGHGGGPAHRPAPSRVVVRGQISVSRE